MMEVTIILLQRLTKYSLIITGTACISAFIIFTMLSLFENRLQFRSIKPKKGLYYSLSMLLLSVGLYQIFMYFITDATEDPSLQLWYYRLAFCFGTFSVPLFFNVVLNLTLGPYTEIRTSGRIKPFWQRLTILITLPMLSFFTIVTLINIMDLFFNTDLLFVARLNPLLDSSVPLICSISKRIDIYGFNPIWVLWCITLEFSFALEIAYLIRVIWFDPPLNVPQIDKSTRRLALTLKRLKRILDIFILGLKGNPTVKYVKTFFFCSIIVICGLIVQGFKGYEWQHSFPLMAYTNGFVFFAIAFVLIGEIIEPRELALKAFSQNFSTDISSRAARIVSHEMATPIMVIRDLFERLITDLTVALKSKDAHRTQELLAPYVMEIKEKVAQLDKLASLSYKLKTGAGVFETKLQTVNLSEIIYSAANIETFNTKGKQFKILIDHIDSRIGNVRIDPEQMRAILNNLIENAIDALLPNDGLIKLATELHNNLVSICIIDNGIGIPRERLGLVKQPYYSTKAKGSGLGIPICILFLDKINGELTIESAPRVGTFVEVTFPHVCD